MLVLMDLFLLGMEEHAQVRFTVIQVSDIHISNNCHVAVCQSDYFICNNANCVPSAWKCDSVDDCGDNSDEQNCNC